MHPCITLGLLIKWLYMWIKAFLIASGSSWFPEIVRTRTNYLRRMNIFKAHEELLVKRKTYSAPTPCLSSAFLPFYPQATPFTCCVSTSSGKFSIIMAFQGAGGGEVTLTSLQALFKHLLVVVEWAGDRPWEAGPCLTPLSPAFKFLHETQMIQGWVSALIISIFTMVYTTVVNDQID